jgi:hypothetical protein
VGNDGGRVVIGKNVEKKREDRRSTKTAGVGREKEVRKTGK